MYRINVLGSQLSPSSINLVPAQAVKVTVGLVSHWTCVTDTVVYLRTGSTAKDREMSTHAYAILCVGPFTLCVTGDGFQIGIVTEFFHRNSTNFIGQVAGGCRSISNPRLQRGEADF